MLEKNPKNRLSAEEALQDEWIVKYASDNVNAPVLENILTSMKQFRVSAIVYLDPIKVARGDLLVHR